jgi:hypothetical protein
MENLTEEIGVGILIDVFDKVERKILNNIAVNTAIVIIVNLSDKVKANICDNIYKPIKANLKK